MLRYHLCVKNLVGEGRFELPLSCSQGTRLQPARPLPDLVARHGIEPCPLAFQTCTLPSSSRAEIGGRCENRTRISRVQAGIIPLYEPPNSGVRYENRTRVSRVTTSRLILSANPT